jgi:peptide-methionine (S)-S-oxide reductase
MFGLFDQKTTLVRSQDALPGRATPLPIVEPHFISGRALTLPLPKGMGEAMFGMGCFWGVERLFWQTPGVWLSMVGYAGGITPNPTYKETCTQLTGHNEVVRVVFDLKLLSYDALLQIFWENHDPTQGLRQGNDIGSTYRSGLYCYGGDQMERALASKIAYQSALSGAGRGIITTEITEAPHFYYAEDYHQQYLAKNPNGYCGLEGTGVTCPSGAVVAAH